MFGEMLPREGWKCVAKIQGTGFKHVWFDDVEKAKTYAIAEDQKGETVYLAQSSFATKKSRTQENVQAVRSYWLDIDCGPGKPYATQGEGAIALKAFCSEVLLPLPAVVNSGNGLYAHWILEDDITPDEWKETACLLKGILKAYGFSADDSRTADEASVLRPVGTTNRKDPENPKMVSVVARAKPLPFETFSNCLKAASERLKVVVPQRTRKSSLNREFAVEVDGPPSKAETIRQKCNHIAYIAREQEKINEPLWYAMLGLVRLCVDGETVAHEWSKDHPGYDPKEVEKKLRQLEEKGVGPTTCAKFKDTNALGCVGCTHEVASPIVLGWEYETIAPTIEADTPPELPRGFKLSPQGLVFEGFPADDDEECQQPVNFYDQELYVTNLAWDESLGYETATIRHRLHHEGWKEFKFRSALTNDARSFHTALSDNHVKLVGVTNKKIMLMYVESYLQKIQRSKRMTQLYCQMGWKDDGRFVLGRNVVFPDGRVDAISLAKSVPLSVESFRTNGDLEPWVAATEVFGRSKDMLPLAFAFCAGAFGAPLLKFTGHSGAMVSMYGTSGVGKTLVGTLISSTYGEPKKLIMLKDDTKNALIGRLGAYGNLPLYIDEVTNADPEELSELVYRITQGRDKARLNRNATERTVNNQWQTLAVVSSNSSIVDKLSGLKQDASAELNRVFEFTIPSNDLLDRDIATGIYRTITAHYGHAGVKYIQYLAANFDAHQAKIDSLVKLIDQRTVALNEERYWSTIAGVTLYGAVCAQKLGLIRFDVSKLFGWVTERIKSMRDTKCGVVNTAMDSLGQMLDDYSNNRLVIGKTDTAKVQPKGSLYIRVETHKDFLYVSRSKVQEWCYRNHASYTAMRSKLLTSKVLIDTNSRKILGARTEWAGSQQPCWLIDMKHPHFGKYIDHVKYEDPKKANAPDGWAHGQVGGGS